MQHHSEKLKLCRRVSDISHIQRALHLKCVPGSSVGITTDYGLDGPGSNPGGDEIFRPS